MREGETKNTAFKRLASNRVRNTIRYLRLVGNLSNTNNYSYTKKEVKKIFGLLEKELRLTKARFSIVINRNSKIKI